MTDTIESKADLMLREINQQSYFRGGKRHKKFMTESAIRGNQRKTGAGFIGYEQWKKTIVRSDFIGVNHGN